MGGLASFLSEAASAMAPVASSGSTGVSPHRGRAGLLALVMALALVTFAEVYLDAGLVRAAAAVAGGASAGAHARGVRMGAAGRRAAGGASTAGVDAQQAGGERASAAAAGSIAVQTEQRIRVQSPSAAGGAEPGDAGAPAERGGEPLEPPESTSAALARAGITPIERQEAAYKAQCGAASAYAGAASARYGGAALRSAGVFVLDWSDRPFFNGLGDELLHYVQLLTLGLDTGRAAFVRTQTDACARGSETGAGAGGRAHQVGQSAFAQRDAHECIFDLADHFGIRGGESGALARWGWTPSERARVLEATGWGDADEYVLRWTPGGIVTPEGKVLVKAEGDVMGALRATPEWRTHPWIRLSLGVPAQGGFDWGHWCHPNQPEQSLCISYNLAVGANEHGSEVAERRAPELERRCGRACEANGCFLRSVLSPAPSLAEGLAELAERLRGAARVVAVQVRTGFADVQRKPRPSLERFPRAAGAVGVTSDDAAVLDAFLQKHVEFWVKHTKQDGDEGADKGHCDGSSAPTLTEFMACVERAAGRLARQAVAQASGGEAKGPIGYVLSSDSPVVLSAMTAAVRRFAPEREHALVVSTADMPFGHVSFPASVGQACSGASSSTCEFDHSSASTRTLLDYLLLASADELLVMFRSSFPLLTNGYHVGGRRTHIFVGQLLIHRVQMAVDGADVPACTRAERCLELAEMWDVLGEAQR